MLNVVFLEINEMEFVYDFQVLFIRKEIVKLEMKLGELEKNYIFGVDRG